MADDSERLVVLLEARIRDFEKNMAKASGTADRNYDRMRKGSRSATRQMEADMQRSTSRINRMLASTSTQIGTLGRSFVAGFAGGVFAGGFAGMVRGVVSELSEMGKQIDRVGLSAKVFQELKFGFGEAGVSASEFTTGMEQFTKRIGEASMGTGRLAEILKLNGVALRDQHGRMRSNEALLRDYADLIKNAGSEQEAMTLATEAFGRGGASFVLALRNGAAGFDDMAKAAAAAGGTIDEDLIRKAEELDDRWAATWRKFEINAKSATMNVITYLDDIEDKFGELGNHEFFAWLVGKMDGAGMIDQTMFAGLNGDIARAGEELASLERQLKLLQQTTEKNTELGFDNTEANEAIAETERRVAELQRQISAMNAEAERAYVIGTPGDPNALAGMAGGAAGRGLAKAGKKTVLPGTGDGGGGGGGGGGRSRNAAADAALREAEAVEQLIASLSHELSLIGQTDLARAKSNALRQAGSAATDDQKLKIEGLVESIHRETEAHERAQAAAEARGQAFENLFQMAGDGLMSIVDGSVKAEDAFKKLAIQIAIAVAQAALLGSGPLAGLFGARGGGGSILGGIGRLFGFSDGTANTGGKRGEPRGIVHGQEAVIPLPSGGKVPVQIQGGGSAAVAESRSVIELRLDKGIEARILDQAGRQSVQIVQAAAPGIVQTSTANTQKAMHNRPGFIR